MIYSEESRVTVRQILDENPRLRECLVEFTQELYPSCTEHVFNILQDIIQKNHKEGDVDSNV